MDPNSALAKIRELIVETDRLRGNTCTNATELADAVTDLDEWLKVGGFLPKAWQHSTHLAENVRGS